MIKSGKDSPFYMNLLGEIDDGMRKDWIIPTVCIGDYNSSYFGFDVVVNANFPYNRIPHRKIGRREEPNVLYPDCNLYLGCTLYLVGLCDHDEENIDDYVSNIIPKLKKIYDENPDTQFLFHCFAGKSRSVAIALAFLVEVMGMAFEDALGRIKEKRPIIEPRPSFIKTLRMKYNSVSDAVTNEVINE